MHVLFPVCAILRRIFTSGILHVQLLLEISIHSADVCMLAVLAYVLAVKTLSSLLNYENIKAMTTKLMADSAPKKVSFEVHNLN